MFTSAEGSYNYYMGDPFGRNSRLARLSVGWEPTDKSMRVLIGVDHLRNPEFNSRYEFVAQTTIRF